MNQPNHHSASTFTGRIEPGPRGPLLRAADGMCWRLDFGNEPLPEGLAGSISVRGRIVQPSCIAVEFLTLIAGDD